MKVYKCSVSPGAGWRPVLSFIFVDSLRERQGTVESMLAELSDRGEFVTSEG